MTESVSSMQRAAKAAVLAGFLAALSACGGGGASSTEQRAADEAAALQRAIALAEATNRASMRGERVQLPGE